MTTAKFNESSLIAGIATSSLSALALGITWPLLSLSLENARATPFLFGVSSAAQSVATVAIAPYAPAAMRRLGLRRTILLSLGMAGLAVAVLAAQRSAIVGLPLRLVLGGALGLVTLTCNTWISQIAPEQSRGRIIGLSGLFWSLSFGAGPALLARSGTGGLLPFALLGGALLAAMAPALFWSASPVEPTEEAHGGLRGAIAAAPAAVLSGFLLGFFDSIVDSMLPIYGMRSGLVEAQAIQLLSIVVWGGAAAQYPAGWLTDNLGRRGVLSASMGALLVAMTALPAAIGEPIAAGLTCAVVGAASAGIWAASLAQLGDQFRDDALAAAMSARGLLYGVGNMVGPLAGGLALARLGPNSIPWSVSLVCLPLVPFLWLIKSASQPRIHSAENLGRGAREGVKR